MGKVEVEEVDGEGRWVLGNLRIFGLILMGLMDYGFGKLKI